MPDSIYRLGNRPTGTVIGVSMIRKLPRLSNNKLDEDSLSVVQETVQQMVVNGMSPTQIFTELLNSGVSAEYASVLSNIPQVNK